MQIATGQRKVNVKPLDSNCKQKILYHWTNNWLVKLEINIEQLSEYQK